MQIDREFLRNHYASLSDEELFSLDRDELVEAAQQIFDEEVRQREQSHSEVESEEAESETVEPGGEDIEIPADWLDEAAEAYSRYDRPGDTPAPEAVQAREALESAGIPAHLEFLEEAGQHGELQYRWRVLVPGKLIHRAASVVDRDLFNEQFESEWRTHLEMLSDTELRVMEPHYAFCGLYDRIDRIERAYREEVERRQSSE